MSIFFFALRRSSQCRSLVTLRVSWYDWKYWDLFYLSDTVLLCSHGHVVEAQLRRCAMNNPYRRLTVVTPHLPLVCAEHPPFRHWAVDVSARASAAKFNNIVSRPIFSIKRETIEFSSLPCGFAGFGVVTISEWFRSPAILALSVACHLRETSRMRSDDGKYRWKLFRSVASVLFLFSSNQFIIFIHIYAYT